MAEGRFAHLYQTYGPAIYARCLRLLRDAAAAEDATQETFLKVHGALDKAPNDDQAFYWIYRIATNHCLHQIRNRQSQAGPNATAPALAELPAAAPPVDEVLADRDLAARLIAHLPPKVGTPAFLHYVDGLEHAEVGKLLGISRRTVINRLAAFQRNAKKFLQRHAP